MNHTAGSRTHQHQFPLPFGEAYPWRRPATEPSPVPSVTPRFPYAACTPSSSCVLI